MSSNSLFCCFSLYFYRLLSLSPYSFHFSCCSNPSLNFFVRSSCCCYCCCSYLCYFSFRRLYYLLISMSSNSTPFLFLSKPHLVHVLVLCLCIYSFCFLCLFLLMSVLVHVPTFRLHGHCRRQLSSNQCIFVTS